MARVNYVQTKSPSWGQAILDLIAAELPAHGAYTLVDTVNSPGGMPALVFKCSGSLSPLGRDWYLAIARTTANPVTLNAAVAEGYEPATKSLIRPAPGTAFSSTIPAADASYGGGTAYPIWSGTTGSTLNTVDIRWAPFGGSYTIPQDTWIVVTRKGVWVWGHPPGRSSSYQHGMYMGWLEPLQANDPGILCVGDWLNRSQATDAQSMVVTRAPTMTTATTVNWQYMAPTHALAAWTPSTGFVNGAGDRLFNGRPIGGRRILRTGQASATYGDFRGLWPDLLTISTVNGGDGNDTVMPGEMMTIYDQGDVGSTYIYAYRYSSAGREMWINTSVP